VPPNFITTVPDTAEESRPSRPGRRLALAGVLMALVAAALFAGVGPGGDDDERPAATPQAGSRFGTPPQRPRERGAGEGPALPEERRIAQLFVVGFDGSAATESVRRRVTSRDWGALLLDEGNVAGPGALRQLVTGVERAARRADHVTPLVVADPAALPGFAPPPAPQVGVEGTPAEARAQARAAGLRLRAAGVRMVLAPPADLRVASGPAEARGFSDEPPRAAALVDAAAGGWGDARVLAAPGRFPGEGGASQDPLEGPATVGLALPELTARDLLPFAAVAPDVPAVQMSAAVYAAWDGVTPATLLPDAVALLRRQLRFAGAVVSADLVSATAATGESVGAAAVAALRAGCDLLVVPGGRAEQDAAVRTVLAAVRRGELPRARVEEAFGRVLALKRAAGIDVRTPSQRARAARERD